MDPPELLVNPHLSHFINFVVDSFKHEFLEISRFLGVGNSQTAIYEVEHFHEMDNHLSSLRSQWPLQGNYDCSKNRFLNNMLQVTQETDFGAINKFSGTRSRQVTFLVKQDWKYCYCKYMDRTHPKNHLWILFNNAAVYIRHWWF